MRNFKRYIAAMMAILMLIALVLPISATDETEEGAAAENGYDRGYTDGRSGDGKIYAHTQKKTYSCEYKLFELENILPSSFVRISIVM